MYVPRLLATQLAAARAQFAAVLVTGPRQSGKTTLLRHETPDAAFVTLDDPVERAFAATDPNGFLDRFAGRSLVIDEAQYAPELLPYLKMRIDAARAPTGRFLLTGSQQLGLMQGVGEHLTGRVAILELLPFSYLEHAATPTNSLAATLWLGGYPEPALAPERRDLWLRSYLATYLERDIRNLRAVGDLRAFQAFIALAAARHTQELNVASLARDAGVSQPTARSWLGLLEATYLATLVPPYFRNLGKRVIRAPKLLFLDSGLVSALTRQPSDEAALAGAMGGPLLEGWVISETIKLFAAAGQRPDVHFWRSNDGLEIDLLVGLGGRLLPVEVKLTATPTATHAAPTARFNELARDESHGRGLLVCRVTQRRELPGGVLALPWHEYPAWLWNEMEQLHPALAKSQP
jgi:uncharacterized protein